MNGPRGDGDRGRCGAPALRLIGLSPPFTGIFHLYGASSVMEKLRWRRVESQLAGATAFLVGTGSGLPRAGPIAPTPALPTPALPTPALSVSRAADDLLPLSGPMMRYRAVTAPGHGPARAAGDTAAPPPSRPTSWSEPNRADAASVRPAPTGPFSPDTISNGPDRAPARSTREDHRVPVSVHREL